MQLKINTDKTEFILFGNQVQLAKCMTESFLACKDVNSISEEVRRLGAFLDIKS